MSMMTAFRLSHMTLRGALLDVMRLSVFVLSAMLIVFISVDTFPGQPFLQNRAYMDFQFWVCVLFIVDFFVGLLLDADGGRGRYIRRRWLFLILSVPYLNLVDHYHIPLDESQIYWVRFIPLARAVMAMAIVVGYVSKNKVTSLFAGYMLILVAFVYFGSLIFFNAEAGVNHAVTSYWKALWWACMDATTIGCQIQPVTATGKIVSAVLACMGVMIFPLFTVYITSVVERYNSSGSSLFNVK